MKMTDEERKAKRAEYNRKYRESGKGKESRVRADKKKYELAKNTNDMFLKAYLKKRAVNRKNEKQEISLRAAINKGKWSQEEIDFLLTSDLALINKAIFLKRTYNSVMIKQSRIKKETL